MDLRPMGTHLTLPDSVRVKQTRETRFWTLKRSKNKFQLGFVKRTGANPTLREEWLKDGRLLVIIGCEEMSVQKLNI